MSAQYDPSLSSAWIQWTQVESAVEDFERVRAIFELAVQQPLDMPEIVWKAYIDFEAGEGERERTRHLYERLLERTSHVKVYISYALMEVSTLGGGEDEDGNEIEGEAGDAELARAVFERGYKDLRTRGEKEDVSARETIITPGVDLNVLADLGLSARCCSKRGNRSRSNTAPDPTWQRWTK